MEHEKIKYQQGYLLIVSIIIIVIISIVATLVINLFGSSMKSTTNVSEGQSAFYLAASGLQIAKRDIIEHGKSCSDINNQPLYTNASLPNISGQYTIHCFVNKISSSLSNNISSTSTTIPLQNTITATGNLTNSLSDNYTNKITIADPNDAQQFSISGGIVRIDNEYIAYEKRNGSDLESLIRGIEGSQATSHALGATISQGFLNTGAININDEAIGYRNISGNNLLNTTRGIMNTTPSNHSANTKAYQDQCILLANASVPNINNTRGKRIIRETIYINIKDIHNIGSTFLFGDFSPALVSVGDVTLKDTATVKNLNITGFDDENFPGSTILTNNDAVFKSNSHTEIATGTSSERNNIRADVQENSTLFDKDNLYSFIFTVDLNTILNNAEVTTSNLNDALNNPSYDDKVVLINNNVTIEKDTTINTTIQPKILIVNGDFSITSKNNKITLGTPEKPIVLIVMNDLKITGTDSSFILYGILYVKGEFSGTGTGSGEDEGTDDDGNINNNVYVEGFVAVEGKNGVKLFNDAAINLNPSIIGELRIDNEYLINLDYKTPYDLKEIFN